MPWWHSRGPAEQLPGGRVPCGLLCRRRWGVPGLLSWGLLPVARTSETACQVAPRPWPCPLVFRGTTVSGGAAVLGALTPPRGHGARCFAQAAPSGGPGRPVCSPGPGVVAVPGPWGQCSLELLGGLGCLVPWGGGAACGFCGDQVTALEESGIVPAALHSAFTSHCCLQGRQMWPGTMGAARRTRR